MSWVQLGLLTDSKLSLQQTRYCVKWRSVEGRLVLKITDDTTVGR